jgi:hypothetical protein
MASAVVAAQAIAPTRPHPGIESAKLNLVVGPFASMSIAPATSLPPHSSSRQCNIAATCGEQRPQPV